MQAKSAGLVNYPGQSHLILQNPFGGAETQVGNSILTIDNFVLWGNVADARVNQTTQVTSAGLGSTTVAYTSLQGWNTYFGGVGNFGDDPMFVDASGLDGASGTEDDDLRLLPGSPCISRGDPAFVPLEAEVDLDGEPRLQRCRVDLGAYETESDQLLGDFSGDDAVDLLDVAYFQNCFDAAAQNPDWLEACVCVFDFDEDSIVDIADFPDFWTALIEE